MLKGVKNSSPGCVTPRVPFGVLPSAGPWASAARTRVNAELQTDGSQRLAGPALIVLGFVSIPRKFFYGELARIKATYRELKRIKAN